MDRLPERPPSPPIPPIIKEGTPLGEGANAIVAARMWEGKLRAAKFGTLGPLEITIAKLAKHHLKCLVKFIGASRTRGQLITSLAPKALEKKPSEALPVGIFLCKALLDVSKKYGRMLVHGDIKDTNIRVSRKGTLKLIDWGCAVPAGTIPGIPGSTGGTYSLNGTPGYLPPEAYGDSPVITEKFDSWAIGITMYKLLSGGKIPFVGADPSVEVIMLGQYRKNPKCYRDFLKTLDDLPRTEGISEEVYNVMLWLLDPDPKTRLSPAEAYRILSGIQVSEAVPAPVTVALPELTPFPNRANSSDSRPKGGSPPSKIVEKENKVADLVESLLGTGSTLDL